MSVDPASAPYRPAYVRDGATGLYLQDRRTVMEWMGAL